MGSKHNPLFRPTLHRKKNPGYFEGSVTIGSKVTAEPCLPGHCVVRPPASYGLFTYTETDTGSNPAPWRFPLNWSMATVVLCRKFTLHMKGHRSLSLRTDLFWNGWCSHFWDRSPSQGKGSVPVSVYVNEPLRLSFPTENINLKSLLKLHLY